MSLRHAFLLLVAAVVTAGCASDRGSRNPAMIVPYADGLTVATAFSRSEEGALRKAVRGAQMVCEERAAPLAVVRTTTVYRGVVPREVSDTVSKVGAIINQGGGEAVPDLATDEDYKVSVDFRCERSTKG
jgi:hypothetical protein